MRKEAYKMAGFKNMQDIEYYEFEGTHGLQKYKKRILYYDQ